MVCYLLCSIGVLIEICLDGFNLIEMPEHKKIICLRTSPHWEFATNGGCCSSLGCVPRLACLVYHHLSVVSRLPVRRKRKFLEQY